MSAGIVLDFIHIEFVLCVVHKGRCAIRGTHSIDNPESAPDTICLHAHAHAHTSTLSSESPWPCELSCVVCISAGIVFQSSSPKDSLMRARQVEGELVPITAPYCPPTTTSRRSYLGDWISPHVPSWDCASATNISSHQRVVWSPGSRPVRACGSANSAAGRRRARAATSSRSSTRKAAPAGTCNHWMAAHRSMAAQTTMRATAVRRTRSALSRARGRRVWPPAKCEYYFRPRCPLRAP